MNETMNELTFTQIRHDLEGHWNWPFVVGQAFLLGRRGWIVYKEEGRSPAERFQLRSDSLVYFCWWMLFSLVAIGLAFMSPEWDDAVGVTGVVIAEFVALSTWRHYFESGDLVQRLVRETHARLQSLLIEGLGLTETELKKHLEVNEEAVVALFLERLKEKPWHQWMDAERERLYFDVALTCGNVIDDHLWEGALSGGCSAYFEEWRRNALDSDHKLRVPKIIQDEFEDQTGAADTRKLCVAVIIGTEDAKFRGSRAEGLKPGRQFVQTRTVRRKVISEGILRWPDCRDVWVGARIKGFRVNTDALFLVVDPKEPERLRRVVVDACEPKRVERLEDIPLSVLYTLREILLAGYVKICKETTEVNIDFKHGFMVFPKEQWNTLMRMRRRPFRFITAATWLAGNVAFKIECKEEIIGISTPDSGILQGTLELQVDMEEDREEYRWIESVESENMWGDTSVITNYKKPNAFEMVLLWMIRLAWKLLVIIKWIKHIGMLPAQVKRIAARKKSEETEIIELGTPNFIRRSTFGHLADCVTGKCVSTGGDEPVVSDALRDWFTGVEQSSGDEAASHVNVNID